MGEHTRRTFLLLGGVAATGSLSGCLADGLSGSSGDDGSTDYTVSSSFTVDDDATPLSFDVAQEGETISESSTISFVFTATNEGSERLTIESGAPPPFGVVWLAPEPDSEREIYPWTDQYRKSDHVDTQDRDVVGAEDIALTTPIEPGEVIERPHALSGDTPRLSSGTYTFDQQYGVKRGAAETEGSVTDVTISGTVEIS